MGNRSLAPWVWLADRCQCAGHYCWARDLGVTEAELRRRLAAKRAEARP